MTSFRADWDGHEEPPASPVPSLRAVSRSAPARPRWGWLYGVLLAASALGLVAHVLIQPPVLRKLADAGCALALLAVLVGWVHVNRVALTRLDEPDAGTGTPGVRIVRSRPRASGDDRIRLPFDSR